MHAYVFTTRSITILLSSCLLSLSHGFLMPHPTAMGKSSPSYQLGATTTVRRGVSLAMKAGGEIPSEEELIKVFGRIADKQIYLDESAGQCCHSGCDNCEWRYDFDVMRAARPKWLVTYQERAFDAATHRAKWVSVVDIVYTYIHEVKCDSICLLGGK